MRIHRPMLVLAPILLGACGDDNPGTANTSGGSTSMAGPTTGGTPTMTGGVGTSTSTNGATDAGAATSTTGAPSTTGGQGGATSTAITGTTDSASSTTANTTGGETMGGAGGSGGTTGGGGSGGTGGGTTGPMTCPYTPPEEPETFPTNWTRGEVTVFNNNGAWTWYNDERVVVDAEAGKIVVSSAAAKGSSNIDVVIHDLATGMNDKHALGSLSYSDDHNNGAIVVKAPGEYFVAYAHHNQDCNSYWANYGNGSWSQTVTYSWAPHGCPWNESDITYNNLWQLSSEGRIYNFVRSVETSPTFLQSEDNGATWTFGGRLTASPQQGYNAGYYKYWGNGVDRIDFFATEAHPRDANTSVFHGYIKGGKSYDSFDKEIDDNLFDSNAPEIKEFTTVFAAGTMINGVALNHLWNFDIARYEDGTVGVLWQGREGAGGKDNPNPNHRILYSRFDGTKWTSTYLVRGGRTLYRDTSGWWEEDYLGGAALDPDDPHVIYVSTPIDPRDDTTTYDNHEIWKGVTCDDGATFQWEPITMNSQSENLRPAVPKWDANNTALLWFRGPYQTAQSYDAQVMGIITRE